MTPALPLDTAAVETLARQLIFAVKAHYDRRPTSRSTVQEVLNALAITTAFIIAGVRECVDEDSAREFFAMALDNQLADIAASGVRADG